MALAVDWDAKTQPKMLYLYPLIANRFSDMVAFLYFQNVKSWTVIRHGGHPGHRKKAWDGRYVVSDENPVIS